MKRALWFVLGLVVGAGTMEVDQRVSAQTLLEAAIEQYATQGPAKRKRLAGLVAAYDGAELEIYTAVDSVADVLWRELPEPRTDEQRAAIMDVHYHVGFAYQQQRALGLVDIGELVSIAALYEAAQAAVEQAP